MANVIDISEQGVCATQETLAKLRPDPFRLLYIRRRLDKNHHLNNVMWDAGLEIRMAFGLIVAPVALNRSDYRREVKRTSWEAAEDYSRNLLRNERLKRRYNRWSRSMSERGIQTEPVLDIVIEGVACGVADRIRKKREGWTVRVLRQGLRLYAEVAGWIRPDGKFSLARAAGR